MTMKNFNNAWLTAVQDNPDFATHLRMAMNLSGFSITQFGVELSMALISALIEKGGSLSVNDISTIEFRIKEKYRAADDTKLSKEGD